MNSDEINQLIESRVGNVRELPTLPEIYLKVSRLLEDPDTTVDDLSKAIEEDPAITTKILKIVNTPFYGFTDKITTVSKAIVIIGFKGTRYLVNSIAIMGLFDDRAEGQKFDPKAFWEHSLATATAARVIAKTIPKKIFPNHEEAFIAGLIHGIGRLVELQFMNDEFNQVLDLAETKKISLLEAENEILGFNYQHVGCFLAEKWHLPNTLSDVICHHHAPDKKTCDPETYPIVSIVHLANILARALQIGAQQDPFIPSLSSECCDAIKIKKEMIEEIMNETELAFKDMAAILLEVA